MNDYWAYGKSKGYKFQYYITPYTFYGILAFKSMNDEPHGKNWLSKNEGFFVPSDCRRSLWICLNYFRSVKLWAAERQELKLQSNLISSSFGGEKAFFLFCARNKRVNWFF